MPLIIINNGTFSTSISTGSSDSVRAPGGKLPWLSPFFALVASVIAALAALALVVIMVIMVNVTVNGPIKFDSDNPVNSSNNIINGSNNIINGSNNTFIGSISNQGDVSLQLGAGK